MSELDQVALDARTRRRCIVVVIFAGAVSVALLGAASFLLATPEHPRIGGLALLGLLVSLLVTVPAGIGIRVPNVARRARHLGFGAIATVLRPIWRGLSHIAESGQRAKERREEEASRPASTMSKKHRALTYVKPGLPTKSDAFETSVAGVTYTNDDGTHRQSLVAKVRKGDPLYLHRDPSNKFDSNAIEVLDGRGRQLGFVPRNHAAELAPLMDAGHVLACRCLWMTGERTLGCGLAIWAVDAHSPEAHDIRRTFSAISTGSLIGCLIQLMVLGVVGIVALFGLIMFAAWWTNRP